MKVPFLDLSLQHRALREPALAALAATYDATRFCLGKDVEDFEKAFGATLGYPRVLGMNSGTAPLHVACMLAGFGPGDEVITAGGLLGRITKISEGYITLEIANNVEVQVQRPAVSLVLPKGTIKNL